MSSSDYSKYASLITFLMGTPVYTHETKPYQNAYLGQLKKTAPWGANSYIDIYGNLINDTPPVAPTGYLYKEDYPHPRLVAVPDGYTYIFGNKLVPYPPDGYEYMSGHLYWATAEYYNEVMIYIENE